jgi:hypothetical protein
MFIAVSYSTSDPDVVIDIEFFFTMCFMADYALRLYIAQDSLRFFFSGVSLLDFITVVPAVVSWAMTGFGHFETDVAVITQCVRVMRVFRVFRIIRVLRSASLSASGAFQRQVLVLVLTVISLIFAAAGMFQILESTPSAEYAFHRVRWTSEACGEASAASVSAVARGNELPPLGSTRVSEVARGNELLPLGSTRVSEVARGGVA